MSTPEKGYLDWPQKRRIRLPSDAADEYMIIRVRDFRRLSKRLEEEFSPHHENIPVAYSTLFGASIATGVAIPPLLTASGLPSWVVPSFTALASSFMALALVLFAVARSLKKGRKLAASEIIQEIHEIDSTYRDTNSASQFGGIDKDQSKSEPSLAPSRKRKVQKRSASAQEQHG